MQNELNDVTAAIEAEISRIHTLKPDEVRALWCGTFKRDVPKGLTRDLLTRTLCWHIQEKAFGGHDRTTLQILASYAKGRPDAQKAREALGLNRAFYAWGHRFLWNQSLLAEALAACGFGEIRWCTYGESTLPFFRGLERHETYEDTPECPHVLIVEAKKTALDRERLSQLGRQVRAELAVHAAVS